MIINHISEEMRRLRSPLFACVILIFSFSSKAQISFRNSADSLGVDFKHGFGSIQFAAVYFGGGVSFFDYDGDGWDDLTFASRQGDSLHFYKNNGGSFTQVQPYVDFKAETKHVIWVDIDNDGDNDLFVTSVDSGNRLFENTGNLSFKDITLSSGMDTVNRNSMTANWADYDQDGLLDVYITNYDGNDITSANMFYRNLGNNKFQDVTRKFGMFDSVGWSMASAMFDHDMDGDIDIYASSDFSFPSRLFQNVEGKKFNEVAGPLKANAILDAMSVTVGDYNNDLDLDIYLSNTPSSDNVFLTYQDNGTYIDSARSSGINSTGWSWAGNFLDADNDGDLDLYVSSTRSIGPVGSEFLENDKAKLFTRPTGIGLDADTADAFSNAISDFDQDGDQDIITTNQDTTSFLWENTSNSKNFICLDLEGTASNRMGVGSKVVAHTAKGSYLRFTMCGESMLTQNSGFVFIGIDSVQTVDSLEITWPNGHVDTLNNLAANSKIKLREGQILPLHTPIFVDGVDLSTLEIGICKGDSITLGTRARYDSIRWNTGQRTSDIRIGSPGTYVREAWIVGGPKALDSIRVVEFDFSALSIGSSDTAFCPGSELRSNIQADVYTWNTGATSRSIKVYESGVYHLEIQSSLCRAEDSIFVQVYDVADLDLGSDTIICDDAELTLDAGSAWKVYNWSTGESSRQIIVSDSGKYSVVVTDSNSCSRYDEILLDTENCNSIAEYSKTEFKVYPNPFRQELIIHNSGNEVLMVRFYSVLGELQFEHEITPGKNVLRIPELSTGFSEMLIMDRHQRIVHTQHLIQKR